MLSRCLPWILPLLAPEEALEMNLIHSVVGLVSQQEPLVRRRPLRAPHHTVSYAGIIGGGVHPRPGEVSLAHSCQSAFNFDQRSASKIDQPPAVNSSLQSAS